MGKTNNSGADNGTGTNQSDVSLADMARAVSGDDDSDESSLRQGEDESDEEEQDDADRSDDDSDEEQDDESSDDESDEEDESEDDEEESDDEEEDSTDDEDDEFSGLSAAQARALLRQKERGVEKLKRKRLELEETTAQQAQELEKIRPQAKSYDDYNAMLSSAESAPQGVANVLLYVAETHGESLQSVVDKALKIANTARPGFAEAPDFEALAKEAATEAGLDEYDDEFERFVKANKILLKKQWDLQQEQLRDLRKAAAAAQPKDNAAETRRETAQAAFEKGFKEAKQELESDYPGFKLTREMALKAVKARPKSTSVEDAVVAMFHKDLAKSQARAARADSKTRLPKSVAKAGGKNGRRPGQPKKPQSSLTMAEMEAQIRD